MTQTRRTPGRPPLPLDRIVAAAVQIVDEQGADALTLRALAQHLDSSTATLYRHFGTRAGLVSHVVDRLLGEAGLDAGELQAVDWATACRRSAVALFDVLRRHRGAAALFVGQTPTGPNAMAQREVLLDALLRGGFTIEVAAPAAATIAHYVLGFAMQLHQPEQSADGELPAVAALRMADPARFPATAKVSHLLPIDLDREFAFGLDLILGGLERTRTG